MSFLENEHGEGSTENVEIACQGNYNPIALST
jgi:hypothetical protein